MSPTVTLPFQKQTTKLKLPSSTYGAMTACPPQCVVLCSPFQGDQITTDFCGLVLPLVLQLAPATSKSLAKFLTLVLFS